MSLNAAETFELVRGHVRCTVAEADLAGGAGEEAGSVAVERCGAGLGACERDAACCCALLGLQAQSALAQVLDHSCLHSKLDPIQRDEPYNVLKDGVSVRKPADNALKKERHTQTQTIPIHPADTL